MDRAMIQVSFTGLVGFALDEVPSASLDATIDYLTNGVTDEQWHQRVEYQIRFTYYKQIDPLFSRAPSMSLPLPPKQRWHITFTSAAFATSVQGHPYIARNYTFFSVLIGSASSVFNSAPSLTKIDGTYRDTFLVPADPEHVLQRTGYACVAEYIFSPFSVNSENVYYFYNPTCDVETNTRVCHFTQSPQVSCVTALKNTIGATTLAVQWHRIDWNERLAVKYRFGVMTSDTADLFAIRSTLMDEVNIAYRFFDNDAANGCAMLSGANGSSAFAQCVDKTGWRQLFRYTTSIVNAGKTPLLVGNLFSSDYLGRGLFEYDSECAYTHIFKHFENTRFGTKRTRSLGQWTFPVRYYNNEFTDLNMPHFALNIGFCKHFFFFFFFLLFVLPYPLAKKCII